MKNNKKHSILNLKEKKISQVNNSAIAQSAHGKLSKQKNLCSNLNKGKLQYFWRKLRHNTSLHLLTLTSAILICTGGEAIAQVCPLGQSVVTSAGNADSQTNNSAFLVVDPNNALGAPDSLFAELRNLIVSGQLTLNLTDLVPEGSTIAIEITRGNTAGTASIEASPDGINFLGLQVYGDPANANTTIPGNTVGILESINYTVPAGGATFLRFTADTGQIRVDAVSYSEICSAAAPVAPTIDLDGDDSSGGIGNNFITSFSIGGSNVKVTDADTVDENQDTVITDTDSTLLSGANIESVLPQVGDQLIVNGALPAGITQDFLNSTPTRIVLTGNATIADYELALELIEFTTSSIVIVPRTVNVNVTDDTSLSSNTAITTINITANPPTLDLDGDNSSGAIGNDFITSYTIGGSNVKITDANTPLAENQDTVIIDTDSPQLFGATIELTTSQTGDQLIINGTLPAGINQDVINSTPTRIVLAGNASIADYELALELIEFNTSSTITGNRSINVTVTDNLTLNSNTAISTVNVVNNPPTLDLDGNDSSGATGNNFTNLYTPAAGAVAAADTDVVVTDDGSIISTATITLTNRPDGAAEILTIDETAGGTVSGITASSYDFATGVLTLNGDATPADYQAVLGTLRYNNLAPVVSTANRIINVSVTDVGGLNSPTATSTITVAPVFTVSGTVYQDGNLNNIFDPPAVISIEANLDFPFTSGVVVRLLSSDGLTELDVTTSDANGNYTFNNLLDGNYQVQVDTNTVAVFYDPGTPTQVPVTVTGANVADIDFGFDINIRNDAVLQCPGGAPPIFDLQWASGAGLTFPNGDLGPNTFTNVSGSGIDLTLEFQDPDGIIIQPDFPRIGNTITGGIVPPEFGVEVAIDANVIGQSITATFTLSQALQDLNFFIFDVDGLTGFGTNNGDFRDEIEVTGFAGTTTVLPILVASNAATVDGNTVIPPFINFAPDESGGNVGVAFLDPVDRVQVRYTAGPGISGQFIAILGSIRSCGVAAPIVDLDANNSSGATGNDFVNTFAVGGGAVAAADTDVSITDDKVFINGATITLTNRPDGAAESLSIDPTAGGTIFGVTASAYDPVSGIITLTSSIGSISLADYEAILATLTYNNTALVPNPSDRIINVQVTDSDDLPGNVAVSTIRIFSGSPPTIDLDGNDSSGATGNNYQNSFIPGAGGVAAADSDVVITDDGAIISSATITLTNRPNGANESLSIDPTAGGTIPPGLVTAVAYNPTTGELTLNGDATIAQYQAIIGTLQYNNTSTAPDLSDRLINVQITDVTNLASNVALSTISIARPPELLLVKRITAINGTNLTGFVNDGVANSSDDNPNWPTPLTDFLRGAIDGGQVEPGQEVEYTVYFLSTGGIPARNVRICDVIPVNTNFVADAFGANSGIALANSSTVLPTAPTESFTNTVNDGDSGNFYPVFSQTPDVCKDPNNLTIPLNATNNTNGAVVVNVVSDPAVLDNAIAPGNPINSYGFIRFKVKVE